MRIDASTVGREFGDHARAYAEFRIFSALARFSDTVRGATVSLTRPRPFSQSVWCSVAVTLAPGTHARVRARGRHAYDAINRAADRVGLELAPDLEGVT
jgi:hypothetical protein